MISDPYISNEQASGSNIARTVSFFFSGLTSSVLGKQNEVVSVTSHESSSREATSRVFASPGDSMPSVVNATWPKQSPMAAVQPQIRVKTEDEGNKRKG